jgi:glycine/D-amino acid oxidase-like deaminating enzyme
LKILIIGQGLAGSVLGLTLLERGHQIFIIDNQAPVTSTKVAAGLFNPITGLNRTKTWKAEQLFPFLKTFYPKIQATVGGNFYHELPIYMPFSSLEIQNEWMAKSGETYWKQWIDISDKDHVFEPFVNNDFGGMETKQSGWLNTEEFILKVADYFNGLGILKICNFTRENYSITQDKIDFAGTLYDKIIYCNGIGLNNDPLFSWLNFAPVKGDIFEIEVDKLPTSHIVNKNGFILPLTKGGFRAGSTYNNFFDDPVSITPKGFDELKEKIQNILKTEFKILKHIAATRPATKDRRPLLGSHPKYNSIIVFNGLGTKGVSLAPYLAAHLADFIEQKTELFPEVNIQRCMKNYLPEHQNV